MTTTNEAALKIKLMESSIVLAQIERLRRKWGRFGWIVTVFTYRGANRVRRRVEEGRDLLRIIEEARQ